MSDRFVMENGPAAGPWRRVEGMNQVVEMAMGFALVFGGTFHQDGRCIYADDTMSLSIVHETGTTPAGDVLDNHAVYVMRYGPDGLIDRVWAVDLAVEAAESFWARNSP